MTPCIDLDELVSLGNALDWDVEQRLSHILSCEACKTKIRELETLHEVMSEEVAPRAGFPRDVLDALPTEKRSKSKAASPVITLVNTLLASMTCFFAVVLASSGAPGVETGMPLLFVALIAGATTFVWNTVKTPVVL